MDEYRFDALTRSLSSRRTALGGLLGGLTALLGLALPDEADAHNFLPRCRKIKNKQQRAACIRRARKHNARHKATPPPAPPPAPCVPNCAGKTCGPNGCGGTCGTCPGDTTCSAGQCICPAGRYGCTEALCCQTGQACLGDGGSETCGACPANSNACIAGSAFACGVPSEGNVCACVTSVENTTSCSTFAGRCLNCTDNDQCAAVLGVPGVCVALSDCGGSCAETNGRGCLPASCVNWCLDDFDCTEPLRCVGASGSTPGTCQ